MSGIIDFFKKVYQTRYFWFFLAVKEIKFKYRRSKLGGLWMMVQPMALSLLLAFVFSAMTQQNFGEYLVYVLSGLVVWNLITTSFSQGGACFNSAEAYIRQFNHPKAIYSLRSALVYTYTFLVELLGLTIITLIRNPLNVLKGLICLPFALVLFFILSWSVTTIVGYVNAKYYDYPQLIGLILQGVYFASPIFLKKEMFEASPQLYMIYTINPISHMLNLVRDPFLYGQFPEIMEYVYVMIAAVVIAVLAYFFNKVNEKMVIFYL